MIYKLTSKVLVNRLKPFMDIIIANLQGAYIPGMIITDKIIVAHELLHFMKHNIKGKVEKIAVKLNMSKAYDRVEWPYLISTMKALGFHPKWIELIMTCVTIDSYSILVNGKLGASFSPTRGLRQRNPLSSYLFLICTKGLSSMISQLERWEKLQGASLGSRGSSRVSLLFFTNYNILFYRATRDEWHKIKKILQLYKQASGQKVNE